MVGGLMPPPPMVTEKVSVRHCDCAETGTAPAGLTTPLLATTLATELVAVDGPVMTKVSKSRRIWQMSLPHGQMTDWQAPADGLLRSK